MLSYALAIAVAVGSLVLFLTAFVMSDIHRRDDFLWSGVGLLYALILWFCARNITGAVLLGQTAATTLLVVYSWQTLKLRKALANPEKAAEISNFSILKQVNSLLKRDRTPVPPATTPETPITPKVTEQEIAIPDSVSQPVVEETVPESKPNPPATSKTIDNQSPVESQVSADSQPVTPVVEDTAKASQVQTIEPQQKTESSSPKTTDKEPPVANLEVKEDLTKKSQIDSDSPAKTAEVAEGNTTDKVQTIEPPQKSPSNLTEASQPIPSGRPEIIEAVEEDRSDRTEDQKIVESSPASSTETEEAPVRTLQEISEVANSDVKPVSQPTAPENTAASQEASKKSHLDSLETVEVAEVLEASPDDISRDRDSDRANVIEVTTTEIKIATEVKKIDEDFEENTDETFS